MLCISRPDDTAKGDPFLRIKSSSSTGLVFRFLNRQKTNAKPPNRIEPPIPTTTPMTTFFWVVLRPLDPPLSLPPAVPGAVVPEPEFDTPGPVGVTISTVVVVTVEVTSAFPMRVTMTVVRTLVEGLGVTTSLVRELVVELGVDVSTGVSSPPPFVGVGSSVVSADVVGDGGLELDSDVVIRGVVLGGSTTTVEVDVGGVAMDVPLLSCRLSMTLSWISISSSKAAA